MYLLMREVRGGEVEQQRCVGIVQWRIPGVCIIVLVGVADGAPLVGSDEVVRVGVWLCVAVLVGVVGGVPLVGVVGGVPLVGVVGGVPLVVAECVAATVGVSSPVGTGSTVLVLKVVLGPMRK